MSYFRVYTDTGFTKERTASVLRDLNRSEFLPFIRFLEDRLAHARETLENATETATLYRAQGHVKELEDILETIAASRVKLG